MKKYGYIETDPKMPWCGEYCSNTYSMFSESGDILVEGIVNAAKETNAPWPSVYNQLLKLGETEEFGEATDTQVRDNVFDAIGYSDDTPFYI